jgi:hypothetical protein
VRGVGPPIDITDEVAKLWAKDNGPGITLIPGHYGIGWLIEKQPEDAKTEIVALYVIGKVNGKDWGMPEIKFTWEQVEKWLDEIKIPAKYIE